MGLSKSSAYCTAHSTFLSLSIVLERLDCSDQVHIDEDRLSVRLPALQELCHVLAPFQGFTIGCLTVW
jgi:hypothetical protein